MFSIYFLTKYKGYVDLYTDEKDRRKTRVRTTTKCGEFSLKYGSKQQEFMKMLYSGIEKSGIKTALDTLIKFNKNIGRMQK